MHTKSIKKITFIGILSAMSFVLFLFPKFPILAAFPWLDLDFSDVPALFASFAISPLAGLSVVFIKNVLHLTMTSTAMIGELSNFLVGGTFVFFAGLIYRFTSSKLANGMHIVLSIAGGVICQIVSAILVNLYLMIPMYSAFVNFEELGGAETYILAGVVPFNFIKDIAVSVVFFVLFKLLNRKFQGFLHK